VRRVAALWSVLTPQQRRSVATAQGLSVIMAFSTITGIAAITPFFAVLADPHLSDHVAPLHWLYMHGGFSSQHSFVIALGLAFIALVLLANLINALGSAAMNRLALRIGAELQVALFSEYLRRPYAFHSRTNSSSLFSNIIYETSRVTQGVLQHSLLLVTNLITASFIIASILYWRPAIAIVMILGLGGGYLLIYLLVRQRLLRIGQAQSHFGTEQVQIVNESFGAIKEILVLQVQEFFEGRFGRASDALSRIAAQRQFLAHTPRQLMECIAAAGLVGLALVLADQQAGVGLLLGQLTFVAFAALRLLPALQQIFFAIVRIRSDWPGLALIAPDLRLALNSKPARASRNRKLRGGTGDDPLRREIRLQDVSFRYAPECPWALDGVSLRIPAGAAVGIVGANGSGKTTVVDIIAGLLVPTVGQVQFDDRVLGDDNRARWQSRVAYVPQHTYLLDATIAQNVALGVASHDIEEGRLVEALRLAQLDEFVSTLPQGCHHRIGERGVALSGGQRQRIGIARALYREASVLLLDEATNALDAMTELELVSTLARLRGRYTSVLIAHRMSTVRTCDVIFQLREGRILDSGTYDELVRSSLAFRHMAGIR